MSYSKLAAGAAVAALAMSLHPAEAAPLHPKCTQSRSLLIRVCDPPACAPGYVAIYTGSQSNCGYRCVPSDWNPNKS